MASVYDNFPEVRHALKAIAQSWDFRGRGRWKTLGEDALDVVSQGIYDRTFNAQATPDGGPLSPLRPSTLQKKHRLGYPETIGVESGSMGSHAELQGERQVERRTASMTYGTNEHTRQEAEWFQEGRAGVQAPRPFYDLDDRIEADLDQLFEEVLEANLKALGG